MKAAQRVYKISYYENAMKGTGYTNAWSVFKEAKAFATQDPQHWIAEELGFLRAPIIMGLKLLDGGVDSPQDGWVTNGGMLPPKNATLPLLGRC
jgi:hypothetical protein